MWSGLPDYGARLIKGFIDLNLCKVTVIATLPNVPIEGMESSLGQKVKWVTGGARDVDWPSLGVSRPDVVFQGGWAEPAFNQLARTARAKGTKVVLMIDHDWTGSLRQKFVDPIRHWLFLRRRFDAILTTGQLGLKFCLAMGYPLENIGTGLYGADPNLFNGGTSLRLRPKTFLFVGQLIKRKKVLPLAHAFLNIADDCPEWSLRICGSGELRSQLPTHPRIQVEGFVQPRELANLLRESRCLVLPSYREHWGLVVHEAALSGCALALSNRIGSRDDLAGVANAVIFEPSDEKAMALALRKIATWSDSAWLKAEAESRRLAEGFGPQQFGAAVQSLVEKTTGKQNTHAE
jgi:glycosyltransferase involved in cell wall biosynthesis